MFENRIYLGKAGNMYRLDYYDKNGNHKEVHGFKTPKEAECYMKNHPEENFDESLILFDSENYA